MLPVITTFLYLSKSLDKLTIKIFGLGLNIRPYNKLDKALNTYRK